ncbi:toll/interleukin-1 receptor domain-containing protein [Sedimenticola hydrogenitrophicus]|uniref:toll/interleukin-1 receptor domain-containing protein n=1 Tax=Sedimenticola hydrogenitrophicus TaxID=2967975 RepID=UPI0021A74303|nr:toll/interleukin-1 receptor domain-containing protein [Sedimenticola hydrogenitrophicus]
MGQIFISYRREGSSGHAGRLEEALEAHFGADQVFRDVEDLTPGLPFPQALSQRIDAAAVMLALIGPHWLNTERDGVRRLDREDDFVRNEVAQALASGKPVVPVLIDETPMPTVEQLPDVLHALAQRQAVRLSDVGWRDDVARLIDTLERWVPPAAAVGGEARMRRRVFFSLAGALLTALAVTVWWFMQGDDFPSGQWQGKVHYDWGPTHQEHFSFERQGNSIVGRASFLGHGLAIDKATWADGVLSFETRTESVMGEERRQLIHRYRMVRSAPRQWRVDYAIHGGFTPASPMEFTVTPVVP